MILTIAFVKSIRQSRVDFSGVENLFYVLKIESHKLAPSTYTIHSHSKF